MPTMRVEGGPLVNKVLTMVPAEELLKRGKYDLCNHNIPFGAFPPERPVDNPAIMADADMIQESRDEGVWLLYCDADLKKEEARKMIDGLGFKPYGVRSLMSFGINYPEAQTAKPVVAIGDPSGYDGYLYSNSGEDGPSRPRKIYVGPTGDIWEAGCRFICEQKK